MSLRKVRSSSLGGEKVKALRVPRIFRFENVAKISSQYSDGTAVAEFPTGNYTYKTLQIAIRSKVAIPEVTIERDGTFYIRNSKLADYIKSVSLEIDNEIERDHKMSEVLELNKFMGYDTSEAITWMTFGGPHVFNWDGAEDAYLLGTGNVDQLRLLFDLSADWQDGQFFLEIMSEYARVVRPLEFINTFKKTRTALGAAGEHTLYLPTSADIARVHVFGEGLKRGELIVDGQRLFEGTNYQIHALNELYGRNVEALPNGFTFDFWRDFDHKKGLKSLEETQQRKRNADIRVVLETLAADTEVHVVMELCGRYAGQ